MCWWETKKHILVREKDRIDKEFPEHDFTFMVRENALWVTGTLLGFFEFECRYPESYPFAPPQIYPKDRSSHWVPKHQYINTGRFCLNIREKTWTSSLSAADIIKSLRDLLMAEEIRKIKKEDKLILYEDDEPTRLQKIFKKTQCIIPSDIDFPSDNSFGVFNYFMYLSAGTHRIVVKGITYENGSFKSAIAKQVWKSASLFSDFYGIWIKTSLTNIGAMLYISEFTELKKFLIENKIIPEEDFLCKNAEGGQYTDFLIFDQEFNNLFFYLECSAKKNNVEPYRAYFMDLKTIFDRVPNKDNYAMLVNKKATIIGCGSVGSKVAEYLTKAGVGKFVLIDNDIITSENIIRHACQLDDISIEKVYAIGNKLQKINPQVIVQPVVKDLYVIDSLIQEKIKDSDVLVVATAANEEIFNEYAYNQGIPAVYSKVYPFGFGGEILRIIPKVTPCFECAHYFKETLIDEQFNDAVFPDCRMLSYDQTYDGQQIPLPALAIDSDFVALITSKLALELLIDNDYDNFRDVPNIILWGNKKEWIFDQPYQCLKLTNKDLKSLENCIVCNGDGVIGKELGKSLSQIDEDYVDIISKIEYEGDGNASN